MSRGCVELCRDVSSSCMETTCNVIACSYGFLLGGMDGCSKVAGTWERVDNDAGQVARFDRRTQRCVAKCVGALTLCLSQHQRRVDDSSHEEQTK
jgi:hypothetical protein